MKSIVCGRRELVINAVADGYATQILVDCSKRTTLIIEGHQVVAMPQLVQINAEKSAERRFCVGKTGSV